MALIKARIRIGFGNAVDQAFLSYPILNQKISTEGIAFAVVNDELEALNRRAMRTELEASQMSVFTFMKVSGHYAIMPCAMKVGNNFGPLLASREPLYPRHLQGKKIAHPGEHTTSYFLLRLFIGQFVEVAMPADRIAQAIQKGEAEAGILIRDDQTDYSSYGLHKVADLGEWFYEMTRLPLALSVFGIQKTLGRDVMRKTTRLLRDSLQYSLDHSEEVFANILSAVPPDSHKRIREWVKRYLDEDALGVSRKIKDGIDALEAIASDNGLIPNLKKIEYVSM